MIYKIIVDKQPMTNPSTDKKEYQVDIDPLYYKHDVYDSLVITPKEDYVMRRLELTDYNVLVELDPPVKEPLTDINIELFEGDNYIYLYDMVGNKIVAEYLVKNQFNETYVIYSEMHSAIRQGASEIELTVGGQVTTLDNAVGDINAELVLKVDKNDNDQVVSMINASADEINLRSNRLVIDSTNFKLNSAGNITATGGDIGGFSLGTETFQGELNGIYDYNEYDLMNVGNLVQGWLNNESTLYDICDANNTGTVDTGDMIKILNILRGTTTNTKNITGEFVLNTTDPKNCIKIKKGLQDAVTIGTGGVNANIVTTKNFVCGETVGEAFYGMTIDGSTGTINLIKTDTSQGTSYSVGTEIRNDQITTPQVIQTSLESKKKNFEKLPSGLDIIKNIDIYKYNMKNEDNDTKKHIGFVIGDKFKYSEEVTSKNNDGVDIYSFVSVCCKAIQEQQEQIEELKKRIEKLEKGE